LQKRVGDGGCDDEGEKDLRESPSEDGGTDSFKVFQREFKTHREEKKNDPDLCKEFNLADIPDQSKAMGSKEDSGDKKTDDGGDPYLMEEKDDRGGDPEEDDQGF